MRYWLHTERIGSACLNAAIFFSLALVGAGCGADEPVLIDSELVSIPTDEMMARDTSYMARLFTERNNGKPFLTLDFNDPKQYKFVISRLLRAGKTPGNSPRLFQRLSEIRATHQASFAAKARAGGAKGFGDAMSASMVGGGGVKCGHFIISSNNAVGNTQLTETSAMMTCPGRADVFSIDHAAYKSDEGTTYLTLQGYDYYEKYGAIDARTPNLQVAWVAQPDDISLEDSVGFAYNEATGEEDTTYVMFKTRVGVGATLQDSDHGPHCELDHPRDSTGDGKIRFCFNRSAAQGFLDCDYAPVDAQGRLATPPFMYIAQIQLVNGQPVPSTTERWLIPGGPVSSIPNLEIPIKGMFNSGTRLVNNAACKIRQLIPDETYAAVTLKDTGGWCAGVGTQIPDDGGQLLNDLRRNFTALGGAPAQLRELPFGEDASTTAYDPDLLVNFGPDCLQNLQPACLIVKVSTKTNCNDISSDFTRSAVCEVCFDVRNSCFAAGTPIRRADGTTMKVEEIQVGEQVVVNDAGTMLTVTATTRGVEPEPMVRLKDSLGHELMLTAKHPVITPMGPVPADELTTLSRVETEDGVASIVEIERVRYGGMVYNLSVGTTEEIAMVSGLNRTMFAGGFRVGDNEMQFDMERQRTRERAKREPSPAWETDRKNAMARKQAAGK